MIVGILPVEIGRFRPNLQSHSRFGRKLPQGFGRRLPRNACIRPAHALILGGRPSYGVESTTVVRVLTFAAERMSWSSRSSSAGFGTRTRSR